MKAGEIREMNAEEIHRKVSDLREELFNLQFQHEIGQLENPQRMKQTKRDIARLETIDREVTLNQKEDSA
ncbi:MAG: 50S ribosomal protein L29 [Deltaproteobacteria bacterium]|nr:50S ribosomal protein L29 [Deltaproteobacteria bacterium]